MVTWRVIAVGLAGLMFCGCQPPAGIVPAPPPGTEFVNLPPADEQPAEALGEMANRPTTRSSSSPSTPSAGEIANIKPAPATAKGETKSTESGVKYETLKEGTGAEAKPGQTVKVHYTGTLENGTRFDSSKDREPFSFVLGKKPFEVITGWEEGVTGMKVGEQRKLTIPPNLGYGDRVQGSIPPNSTLIFEVELLEAK